MSFPDLPGIPPLDSNDIVGAAIAVAAPAVSNSISKLMPADWGVFDKDAKKAVLTPDSVISFDYRATRKVAHFPLEDGGFESYNKVIIPPEIDIRIVKGGTEKEKTSFLESVETMVGDTNFYTVMTPNKRYANFNLDNYGYRRAVRDGAQILIVNLHFVGILSAKVTKKTPKESMITPPNATSTGSASSQASVNNGSVNTSASTRVVSPT